MMAKSLGKKVVSLALRRYCFPFSLQRGSFPPICVGNFQTYVVQETLIYDPQCQQLAIRSLVLSATYPYPSTPEVILK